jgi:hypothetical protein
MYFGHTPLEGTIAVAEALWSTERLDGPYRERHIEPSKQRHCDYTGFTEDGCEQLVGVLSHPDGSLSTFVRTTVCDDDGLWIYIGTPTGGLPTSWDVGAYPFDDGKPTQWLPPLFETLRQICEYVHARCPAKGAIYGWDTLADPEELLKSINGNMPVEKWAPISIWTPGGGATIFQQPTQSRQCNGHNKARMDNPHWPFCFQCSTFIQPQPRDQRWSPLVGLSSLQSFGRK